MREIKDVEIAKFYGVSKQAVYSWKRHNRAGYELRKLLVSILKNEDFLKQCNCYAVQNLLFKAEQIEKLIKESK